MLIFLGVLAIVLLTAATGYFVAQEFAYVAADRGRAAAARPSRATSRPRGPTRSRAAVVHAVGRAARDHRDRAAGRLHRRAAARARDWPAPRLHRPPGGGAVCGVRGRRAGRRDGGADGARGAAAQEPRHRQARSAGPALAGSTLVVPHGGRARSIRFFDGAANRLLRTVGIEPVEELPQGATEEDLRGSSASRTRRATCDAELSQLLDRGLDFRGLVAEQAMTPRVDVHTVRADEPASRVVELLDTGHSRFPVIGEDVDDLVGVVGLAEVLTVEPGERTTTPIRRGRLGAGAGAGPAAAALGARTSARRAPPAGLRLGRVRRRSPAS